MPTENRSSNTEMVSVPRDEVERLVKLLAYQAHPYPSPHAEYWQGILDAPAQHQGEPVALPAKRPRRMNDQRDDAYDNGWNNCLDEIAKLGPLYTHPAPAGTQGEPLARYSMDQTGCEELNPDGPWVRYDDLNRDPGEVERWKKQAEYNQDTALRWLCELEVLRPKVERLRAQLAERGALLREGVASCYEAAQMAEQIERAEPIRVSTTLLAPARPFKLADAKGKAGVLKDRLIEVAEALSASAEQSAPVEREELPEFARTVIAKLMRLRDCAEDGQDADIGRNWFDTLVQLGLLHRVQRSPARWEITCEGDALIVARAALERKPS